MRDGPGETATPIERMYRAGKIAIPGVAGKVSGTAQSLQLAAQKVNVQTALAGDPRGMRDLLEQCEDLHGFLRGLTESLNDCAEAVVGAGEEFARTDQQAARDLESLDDDLRDGDVPTAVEVAEIDDMSAPGATEVSAPDNSPTKTYETHIDSTPAPEHVPTVEENQRDRDARVDDVPVEVSR